MCITRSAFIQRSILKRPLKGAVQSTRQKGGSGRRERKRETDRQTARQRLRDNRQTEGQREEEKALSQFEKPLAKQPECSSPLCHFSSPILHSILRKHLLTLSTQVETSRQAFQPMATLRSYMYAGFLLTPKWRPFLCPKQMHKSIQIFSVIG